MTRKKFLFNQFSLLIVVALFLIDKSMFYSWVRNFFNMLNISNIEPIVMALWAPIKAVHGIVHLLSPLYLLQFVLIISIAEVSLGVFFRMASGWVALDSINTIPSLEINDTVENSKFTYLQTQRFLC